MKPADTQQQTEWKEPGDDSLVVSIGVRLQGKLGLALQTARGLTLPGAQVGAVIGGQRQVVQRLVIFQLQTAVELTVDNRGNAAAAGAAVGEIGTKVATESTAELLGVRQAGGERVE